MLRSGYVYDSVPNATLLQQRSPVFKGMMIDFAKDLANYAASSGKKHVTLLSSLVSGRRQQIDMSSQIYYLSGKSADETDGDREKLGWKVLEEYKLYTPTQRRWKYLTAIAEGKSMQEDNLSFEDELDEDFYPSLPFAALFSCCKAKGLKVTCLICYCSEGDNKSDSLQLTEASCKLLKQNPNIIHGDTVNGWVIPYSWQTVYGPPPDMSLF